MSDNRLSCTTENLAQYMIVNHQKQKKTFRLPLSVSEFDTSHVKQQKPICLNNKYIGTKSRSIMAWLDIILNEVQSRIYVKINNTVVLAIKI